MFTIIQRKKLTSTVTTLEVFTPRIAAAILPGQYVSVKATSKCPLLMLPVCGWSVAKGSITLLVEVTDTHTRQLANIGEISILHELNGPLGQPSELTLCHDRELINSRLLFAADGIGAAIALSQMKWLADIGCRADILVSATMKDEMLFSSELERVCDNIYYATQDGSLGFHGPEAQLLEMLLNKEEKPYDLIIAAGPLPMMKAVTITANGYGIPVTANLTPQLLENDLQHGPFKISADGKMKNVATEGPEFPALSLDFEQALSALRMNLHVSAQQAVSSDNEDSKILNLTNESDKAFAMKQA
jgi:NAD(P)H-flavin reductase